MPPIILTVVVPAVLALIFLVFVGIVLSRLYKRSTREISLLRTGAGGRKVIMDGGCLVVPVLHELTRINMRTLQISVRRSADQAMITKDRLRVDSTVEFFVRVAARDEDIATAAQTLGDRTFNVDKLKEMIEGKLVDGLRAVAAQMSMDELHEQRADFVQRVKEIVSEDLRKNGLELESVSLTALDQTPFDNLDENNAFNAEGMRVLAEAVAKARVRKSEAEAEARVKVAQTEQAAELREMDIRRGQEEARVKNAITIAEIQAGEKSAVAEREQQVKRAEETARIARERAIREAEIESQRDLELREQDRAIAVAERSEAESVAKAAANKARAEAIRSEEAMVTAREIEEAERRKRIAVLQAEEVAERNATEVRVSAQAERQAAEDRAAAVETSAKAEANAITIRATAEKDRMLAEAEGKTRLIEAENAINPEILAHREMLARLETLPGLMNASMKPVEKINSIHLHQINGLGQAGGAASGTNGSMAGDLHNLMAAQAVHLPIMKKIAEQSGMTLDKGAEGILESALGTAAGMKAAAEAPADAPANDAPSA